MIELSYQYPVATAPPHNATPKEVGFVIPGIEPKPVMESPLGIRQVVVPGLVGGAQIRGYLMADAPGMSTIEFMIDKVPYKYTFEVTKK